VERDDLVREEPVEVTVAFDEAICDPEHDTGIDVPQCAGDGTPHSADLRRCGCGHPAHAGVEVVEHVGHLVHRRGLGHSSQAPNIGAYCRAGQRRLRPILHR
jgi:hypothetical protein